MTDESAEDGVTKFVTFARSSREFIMQFCLACA